MDGFPLELSILVVATFVGALVSGLTGFAFGLVDRRQRRDLGGRDHAVLDQAAGPARRQLARPQLFGRLNEAVFRNVVLVLLLASGVMLVV
jgi:hypothetical protein